MSRVHRAARRRSAREAARHAPRHRHVHQYEWVSTVTGWCATEDDLPEVRQKTHDKVISMLGPARRSGVRWVQVTGEKAAEHLDRLGEGITEPALSGHYRRCRGLLREHGGWIVTAMADAEREMPA